jgi:hypothetical protein
LLSQMTVSKMMATIDVKMLMEKSLFQSIAAQTDRGMRLPDADTIYCLCQVVLAQLLHLKQS